MIVQLQLYDKLVWPGRRGFGHVVHHNWLKPSVSYYQKPIWLAEKRLFPLNYTPKRPQSLKKTDFVPVADFTSQQEVSPVTHDSRGAHTPLGPRDNYVKPTEQPTAAMCLTRPPHSDSATVCGSLATQVAALPAAGAHELRVARALAPLGPVGAARVGVHAGHRRWRALGWLLRRGRPHGA